MLLDVHGELYCVVCWHEWMLDEHAEFLFGRVDDNYCYVRCCVCNARGYLPMGEKKASSMILGNSYIGYANVMVNDVAVTVYEGDKNIRSLPKRIMTVLSAVSVHELSHLFSGVIDVIDNIPKEFWLWLVI